MTERSQGGFILPGVAVTAEGDTACAACGHGLGAPGAGWKSGAARREVPLARAGGPAYDTGAEGVVIRQFSCPGCGELLDTETARPEDPALEDQLGIGDAP